MKKQKTKLIGIGQRAKNDDYLKIRIDISEIDQERQFVSNDEKKYVLATLSISDIENLIEKKKDTLCLYQFLGNDKQ